MDKDLVKEQLDSLVGASVGDSCEINLDVLSKEIDKTCLVVNKFLAELKNSAEEHLDNLNEISSFLESCVASAEDQEMLIRLDKVIDFLFDLQKD